MLGLAGGRRSEPLYVSAVNVYAQTHQARQEDRTSSMRTCSV